MMASDIDVGFKELATHYKRDDGTRLLIDWSGMRTMYVIIEAEL